MLICFFSLIFNYRDHILNHRQIVPLPNIFGHIKFIDPNTALAALMNHSILLTDLSAYNVIEPTTFIGHKNPIKDIQIFLNNYFVSLDTAGVCKVWSLKNTPFKRQSTSNRHLSMNSHRRARKSFSATYDEKNIGNGELLQTLDNDKDPIKSIYLINRMQNFCKIIAGTQAGRILTYEWNDGNSFDLLPVECFGTKSNEIISIVHISPILILLDASGKLYFYNLKNNNELPCSTKWIPQYHPICMHYWRITKTGKFSVIIVFKQIIFSIKYEFKRSGSLLFTNVEELYKVDVHENSIVCSALSNDGKYIVLGTKRGIVVYDPSEKKEILRSHISEHVITLDICEITNDSKLYKHLLISGTKQSGPSIILNGLEMIKKDLIQWSTNEIHSWLNYEHFYVQDINHPNDFNIIAVDSLKRINCKMFEKSMVVRFVTEPYDKSDVNAFTVSNNGTIYVGYENGLVYQYYNDQPIIRLEHGIQYLATFDDDVLIASTKTKYKIKMMTNNDEIEFSSSQVVKTFQFGGYLLVVKIDCSFDVSLKNFNS